MFDVGGVRARFPALRREVAGTQAAYLDGPGGTQVPRSVIEAMSGVLERGVSNLTPRFASGAAAIEVTDQARVAIGDLLNAPASGVVFGQNMTSLTLATSRAIAQTWQAGDEIVVTDLDHDANRTPWILAARDRGVTVRTVRFDPTTFRLDPEAFAEAVGDRTRLVAVTLASNAIGTVVDVARVAGLAHAVGALVYVDAVHFAPHGVADVEQLDCDFLVASAYKFFGPHTGCLFGRPALLDEFDAYKVRPAPPAGPGKWETGTQSFESLAGVTAAVDHLASLGEGPDRRQRLVSGYAAIHEHESVLGRRFLDGIAAMEHVTLYGVPEMEGRVPTFTIAVSGVPAARVARRLGKAGVFVWDGHYYAIGVMESLGFLDSGGLVRVGFVHYNTTEEVDRLLDLLAGFG